MEMTLENFIVDNSNETAYKAIKKLLKDRKEYLPIYIYGKVGLGKTHLVTGIANKAMEKDRVFLTTCENFINDFMKSNEEKNYLGKYYNCEFLILEDVQYILGKKSIQKEINKIVDDFVSKNKKIVLTLSTSSIIFLKFSLSKTTSFSSSTILIIPLFNFTVGRVI